MARVNVLVAFLFYCITFVSGTIMPEMQWSADVTFDGGLHAKWTKGDPEWITFEIQAPTMGWVGIGFSPNGGMKGADIVIGWVDNSGTPHLKDLYGVSNSVPLEDKINNYELLGAEQDSSTTCIRFRRKWNTCDDAHDYKINDDTLKFIWAFGNEDPDEMKFNPAYHGLRRGVKNVYLKVENTKITYPEDNENDHNGQYFDVKMENFAVPPYPTTYFCKIVKFPETQTKNQIIGWRPMIDKANYARIHHFLLYECNVPVGQSSAAIFEKDLEKVVPCYSDNMPPDWNNYCWTVPIAWTLGAEGEMMPEHLGLPMGEAHGGANYFMFEVHYDNPEMIEFTDSSGIRIYYTDELREFDMGMLWIGSRFSGFQFIPPHAKDYNSIGGCTSECTAKAIPPGGITASHVVLHAHTTATKVTLKHIRDGKELPPLGQDKHYDYNYQQARIINPPAKILPGDSIITYCEYDTTKQDKPLYGGITTKGSEMCISFLFYYPKIPLTSCQWQTEFNTLLSAVGVRRVDGKVLDLLKLPYKPSRSQQFDPPDEAMVLNSNSLSLNPFEQMKVKDWNWNRGKTVAAVIDALPWTKDNGKLVQEMKTKFEGGNHYAFCTAMGRARIPLKKYITTAPNFTPYVEPPEVCVG